jgi:hypothetical protein
MIILTAREIIALHSKLIAATGGSGGTRLVSRSLWAASRIFASTICGVGVPEDQDIMEMSADGRNDAKT